MEQELNLSIISGGVIYVYEGGECKECAFRESCIPYENICGAFGLCGSFAEKGRVTDIKVENKVND